MARLGYHQEEKKPISFRIDKEILQELKKEAAMDMFSGGYQGLMHRILVCWYKGLELPPRYIPKNNKKKITSR